MKAFKFDFVVLAALCILYLKYIPVWTEEWFNFDSFYSFFPFLIVFGVQFFKIKTEELKKNKINPNNWGLFPLIIGGFVYYAGIKADMALIYGLSLPLILSGAILFLYGKRIFMTVLPVIILFSLAIPVFPVFRITAPLQIFLADAVTQILCFLNINAHALGSDIYIDRYLVTIEAGCTGIKSISSLTVVVFLLFYFRNISVIKKVSVVLFALLISFSGNIMRILFINFYVIYNGPEGAESFHYGIGFAVFVISLLIILFMNEFIEDDKIVNHKEISAT